MAVMGLAEVLVPASAGQWSSGTRTRRLYQDQDQWLAGSKHRKHFTDPPLPPFSAPVLPRWCISTWPSKLSSEGGHVCFQAKHVSWVSRGKPHWPRLQVVFCTLVFHVLPNGLAVGGLGRSVSLNTHWMGRSWSVFRRLTPTGRPRLGEVNLVRWAVQGHRY